MSVVGGGQSKAASTYLFLLQHVLNSVIDVVLRELEELGDVDDWVALVFLLREAGLRVLLGVHLIMEYYLYEE